MREKTQRTQDGAGPDSAAQALPLRYINPNYTIPGVPARDLSAHEARCYGPKIAAVQAGSGVVIYEEVNR